MGALGSLARRGKKAAGIGFTGYLGKAAGEDIVRRGAREADPIGGTINAAFLRGDVAAARAGSSGLGRAAGSLAAKALGKRAAGAVATGSRAGAYAPLAIATAFAVGETVNTARLGKELHDVRKKGRQAEEGAASIKQAMYNKYPLKDTVYDRPRVSRGSIGRPKQKVVKVHSLAPDRADWVGTYNIPKPKVVKM